MPEWIISVISVATIGTIFGAGVAWGLNKKTTANLEVRVNGLADKDAAIEESLDRIDREMKSIQTLLTGVTGNNGLNGDMKQVKDKLEGVSDIVIAIATKMEIPIRRAFK